MHGRQNTVSKCLAYWLEFKNDDEFAGRRMGSIGGRPVLGEVERAALRQVVEEGPIPAVHGVVRWRIVDLMQWLWEEFRLSVSKQTMSKELRAMGLVPQAVGAAASPCQRRGRRGGI